MKAPNMIRRESDRRVTERSCNVTNLRETRIEIVFSKAFQMINEELSIVLPVDEFHREV